MEKKTVIVPMGLYLYDDFKSLADENTTVSFYDVRNQGHSSHITDSILIEFGQDVHNIEAVRKHFGVEKVNL